MSIKTAINDALKTAMKNQDKARLECLRMAKGALLMVEKESSKDTEITDEQAILSLRTEVRKRQQSLETYQGLGQQVEVDKLRAEILVIEEFLPAQLGEAQLEEKARAYLAEHPEMNHAGKLTGMLKKELGDAADGKVLSEVCRRVLGG